MIKRIFSWVRSKDEMLLALIVAAQRTEIEEQARIIALLRLQTLPTTPIAPAE